MRHSRRYAAPEIMSLTNGEAAFIAQEEEKQERDILKALRSVHNHGKAPSMWWSVALELWGFASFGGPRPEIAMRYNCERLTPGGLEKYTELHTKYSRQHRNHEN